MILHNTICSLEIDLFGGAITNFHLHDGKVNPLSFRFLKEQMPQNNQSGAVYQGHFLCLGRWGEPSKGELEAGMPDHGEAANILWEIENEHMQELNMRTTCKLEGLHIDRTIRMHTHQPVYMVNETVTNINPLGRLYNMVQHPTLAFPFMTNDTIINCNAEMGFNYNFFKEPEKNASRWPTGITADKSSIDLRFSSKGSGSSVFSFIVSRESDLGWIAAYSQKDHLLFGYLWRRKDYPWINLWQDWQDGQIRYRGLEFGTTGIHKPFRQILEDGNDKVFGESTIAYIDAGEKVSRSYLSFLHNVQPDFKNVDAISLTNGCIKIKTADDVISMDIGYEL